MVIMAKVSSSVLEVAILVHLAIDSPVPLILLDCARTAWDVCIQMKENGLLAKPTHGNIIRFAPPLTITESEIDECLDIIEQSVKQVG